jgi:sterol desaturase/sphingolipid hydroxylase (fatty acid hydroxylase superfamily)
MLRPILGDRSPIGLQAMTIDFRRLSAIEVMAFGLLYFATLYVAAAVVSLLLTRSLLPALGLGRRLDPRPLGPGQLRRELSLSASSVLIFGLGLIVPWGLLQLGWARLEPQPGAFRIALEFALLLVWNELHFYVCHRLLHTRPLRRFHAHHHRSIVTTPWSTYSFHPVEALLLGSVPLLPMLVHDFSFAALAALPVLSIALNSIGHSNYSFIAAESPAVTHSPSYRHHRHHVSYHGNYGFLLSVFDRWFGTALPPADDSRPPTVAAEGPI